MTDTRDGVDDVDERKFIQAALAGYERHAADIAKQINCMDAKILSADLVIYTAEQQVVNANAELAEAKEAADKLRKKKLDASRSLQNVHDRQDLLEGLIHSGRRGALYDPDYHKIKRVKRDKK